ncbi:MAG: DEAD/DEAH box helicase [Deltaproteobacteria bacterium]|nr:DEAD/DEAH box helicase [Deltaproteobacteria bacterium]TLN04355.1 MAG: DEAD/DEAH box helicase [bacterium]
MNKLTDIEFPPILDTSSGDIIKDFFNPALAASVRYDRGVGFFSAAWLRLAAQGMTIFAANGGYARWVTSPILSEDDWNALQEGSAARIDETLRLAMEENIHDLRKALNEETRSALAWLVADGILDFKLALPRNKLDQGEFHDKFGIFTDAEGNQVSFNGSYNDSIQGTRNYESIKIFSSNHPVLTLLVKADSDRFARLWSNNDPNVQVYDLPEAAKANIIKLRTQERPYPEPNKEQLSLISGGVNPAYVPAPTIPPTIELRDYQNEAIDSWFAHDCQGLLEMATGTGKTITALAASVRLYEREKRLAVIMTVPYQHLVDQWQKESQPFGYRPILAYQSKSNWFDQLNSMVMDFSAGYRDTFSVITTHTTFASNDFQSTIARLNGPSLIIADEAHHLGAERSRQNYPQQVPFRLALSATPDRWFDDEGTAALRSYFGETVFVFPLEQAIGVSLTPYYYYPHLVQLTDAELEDYQDLSTRIAQLAGRDDERAQESMKLLLMRRAELLNKATNKIVELSKLIEESDYIEHTLFYCAPGQIDDVQRLLGWEHGLLVQRFTAEEDTRERQQRLADFASGEIQALVAMKCLDEGVDVPSTRTAYIMASSSNPREFIQRRGRVLRKSPGKEFSVIHDMIAVPPTAWTASQDSVTFNIERGIIRKELERFKEFASPALNKHKALDVIWEVASRYNLMDF